MQSLGQDLRYALRQMRKSPGFAIVAVLTLALGIGANSAIFSLFDQVMLRQMPVRNPGQLVLLKQQSQEDDAGTRALGDSKLYFSYHSYLHLRDDNHVFDGLLASTSADVGLTSNNSTEHAQAELVSGNYFDVLGMRPSLGRLITPADDVQRNGSPVIVLSYEFWQRRFGADGSVLNRSVRLNGQPFTIVGVAAPGYQGLSPEQVPQLYVPLTMVPQIMSSREFLNEARNYWLNIVGRLQPGVTAQQAQTALVPVWNSWRELQLATLKNRSAEYDTKFRNSHLTLEDGSRGLPTLRDDFGTPILALMAMVFAVLLIACANVANLLMVKAAGRRREMALRGALGASRRRIFQQVMLEGALLGLLATCFGLILGQAALRALIHGIPNDAGMNGTFTASLDGRVFAFTVSAAILTSLLFSLMPAFAGTRITLTNALREQSTAVRGGGSRLRSVLVSGEVMLSLVLLVAAGLFVRTLRNMRTTNIGFRSDHLETFDLNPKLIGRDTIQTKAEYQRISGALRAQPGVESVSYGALPLLNNNDMGGTIRIAGYTPSPSDDMDFRMDYVSPDYFSTLQIPLFAGRVFTDGDQAGAHKVGIINETFAKRYFGSPSAALGHMFCHGCERNEPPDVEVVGVVRDSKFSGLREKPAPFFYFPYQQARNAENGSFFVRTEQAPDAAASAIRSAVANIDPNLPIQNLETMQEHIDAGIFQDRLVSELSVVFGTLAALLAAIGLYGVLAYSVAQRTQEIGVRMALGANRAHVVRLVLRQVLIMAGVGIVLAIPVSLVAMRVLRSQLYGVSSSDPTVFIAVSVLLVLIALLAGLIPARRAASVDPMRALRTE